MYTDPIAKPDPINMRGYLKFEYPSRWEKYELENADSRKMYQLIDGNLLGNLLVDNDIQILILNACRSAYAEVPEKPIRVDNDSQQLNNFQVQKRAFGSLAQEVMNAGVAGVVAMRYNVYVVTAAQFIADLYISLAQGKTIGEAVTSGRKQLAAQPKREIAYKPIILQDWIVPIAYEATPIAIFPTRVDGVSNAIFTIKMLETQLLKAPDNSFFGRDETLLAIDRAFNYQSIVLLYGLAGSGKSSTAVEVARWYVLTGGIQGDVLFTSFESYQSISGLLDKIGQVFEQKISQREIPWLALSDEERRKIVLKMLNQTPVLWIWDNVEPIAGFPESETQRWSKTEQQDLFNFLQDAKSTKAKFLLTSRRDERQWLGELPVRLQVPPMPLTERVQLTQAIANNLGYTLNNVEDWLPLLKFTEGNLHAQSTDRADSHKT